MLDFRIHTFLCVCRYMNYTKAAAALQITQPAVSQHIRYLERKYGVKLFDYTGKRLALTEAGHILLNAATTISHDDTMLKQSLVDLKMNYKSLRFGITHTIGESEITEKLVGYLRQHPEMNLYMKIGDAAELLTAINEGEIDFAVVEGFFDQSEYETLLFGTEALTAVCSSDYEAPSEMTVEELLNRRIIFREQGSGTRTLLEQMLAEQGLSVSDFQQRYEVGSPQAIKELVERGCGIGFLFEQSVSKEVRNGVLRCIHIKGCDATHTSTFIWRKGSMYSTRFRYIYDQLKG